MTFRMLFVFSLLLWAVMLDNLFFMALLLLASVILLCCYGAKAVLFKRSLRLLLWLFVPIVVFHGLLTPGTYMQQPIYLPLSIEGLERALFLCLHISVIFFSALLVSRMVMFSEWARLLYALPRLGQMLMPYVLLLPELQRVTKQTLSQQRILWMQTERRWLSFPHIFLGSMELLLQRGKEEADALWFHWDKRVMQYTENKGNLLTSSRLDIAYGLLVVLGWSIMWIK